MNRTGPQSPLSPTELSQFVLPQLPRLLPSQKLLRLLHLFSLPDSTASKNKCLPLSPSSILNLVQVCS